MAKLLVWGDALFLVRCEFGELEVQRILVCADKKSTLRRCSVKFDKATVLPPDARLVATKEVVDTQLAIRYPVLVIRASGEGAKEFLADPSPVFCKSQRPSEGKNTDTTLVDKSCNPRDRLIFCIMHENGADGEIGLHLLNTVEISIQDGTRGDGSGAFSGIDANSLQYFLTDGPYLILFQRFLQIAAVLKLQRSLPNSSHYGFYLFIERVDIIYGMKNMTSALFELVACVYVSKVYCSNPHLLIHARQISCLLTADGHIWSILELDSGPKDTLRCDYLTTEGIDIDRVTCCCFISNLKKCQFSACNDLINWNVRTTTRLCSRKLMVSALVVAGTTNNTVLVHANGRVLVSYVLPARPADIWLLDENCENQNYVFCVRCDDVKRSFFVLEFCSNVQNDSMNLLLSFNNVLLLNSIPGLVHTDDNAVVNNKLSIDTYVDYGQLIKRSVLITQKTSAAKTKLTCHRLRLHTEEKSKRAIHYLKRSRNEKNGNLINSVVKEVGPKPFHYIERTQKASSRMDYPDEEIHYIENALASKSQLGKLVGTLSARLSHEVHNLKRLHMVMGDKRYLARQLCQLTVHQWQLHQLDAKHRKSQFTSLSYLSNQTRDIPSSRLQGFLDMKTIVKTSNTARSAAMNQDSNILSKGLSAQIMLQQFRVLSYAPSSSLLHVEVVLRNQSGSSFNDAFVVLTAPEGSAAQGWTCSSSVVSEFVFNTDTADHLAKDARFSLDLHFVPKMSFLRNQKPLDIILWLYWGSTQDVRYYVDWQPGSSAYAVSSVKIYPNDVLSAARESCGDSTWCHESILKVPLLFLSSGSNLISWYAQSGMNTFKNCIIRQKFLLMDLTVAWSELMMYEISKTVATMPSDVYVMRYPLEFSHLRALQLLLRSMRQEFFADKQQTSIEFISHGSQTRTQNTYMSNFRTMQYTTDLQATQLLQTLQKRVNFHMIWFDYKAFGTKTCSNKCDVN
ncbi:hypothetical protein CCR75_007394 [Bremia lactucae]|uniref:Uncharacterized protein n=1 Tax=Bremia lactucae TaxID=4779 RepID=A0A976NZ38_BRELC|nr:hypothetical protein CCR75_007394 [Bremia lactucae]